MINYQAIGIHESFIGGKKAGSISFQNGYLHFKFGSGDSFISLPLRHLKISITKGRSGLIYFSHHDIADWIVYTSDFSILKNENLKNDEKVLKYHAEKNKRKSMYLSILWSAVTFILISLILLITFRGEIVTYAVNKIPKSWEKKIGEEMFTVATTGKNIIKNNFLDSNLKVLTDPLVDIVENEGYTFKFYIIKDEEPNAFALPGGIIVIHTGLLEMTDSDEELQGVVAHEIAHVTKRHHLRNIFGQAGISILLEIIVGEGSSVLGALTKTGASMGVLAYSRDFEHESDVTGWNYLLKAGIDPRGMISFFQKLSNKNRENGKLYETISFLSTHPGTEDRIDDLNEKWKALKDKPVFRKTGVDFHAFVSELKKWEADS